jgi:hypothetical protein
MVHAPPATTAPPPTWRPALYQAAQRAIPIPSVACASSLRLRFLPPLPARLLHPSLQRRVFFFGSSAAPGPAAGRTGTSRRPRWPTVEDTVATKHLSPRDSRADTRMRSTHSRSLGTRTRSATSVRGTATAPRWRSPAASPGPTPAQHPRPSAAPPSTGCPANAENMTIVAAGGSWVLDEFGDSAGYA